CFLPFLLHYTPHPAIYTLSLHDRSSDLEKNIVLSRKDERQLKELLFHIEQTYVNSLTAFKYDDRKRARKNIQTQTVINKFEKDVKLEHFNHLIDKHEYNPNISAVYLDIINQLLQVYHHTMNISRTVLGLI